jgi:UDP-N-acetylmuramate--alanine ligase
VGKSDYFVIEADEFQNKLQYYNPFGAILTSVDWDHPDFYPTFAEYKKAFSDFVARIPKIGFLAVWGDSADTLEVAKSATCDVISYGFNEENDVVIKKSKPGIFELMFRGKYLGVFKTRLIGDHNLLNAASVVATCFKLNVDLEKMREAVGSFRGTTRRFEVIGEKNGAILVDDYAHHPEEIKSTLKAARELYPEKNIITVFHPHSYSRTESLLEDFAQAFDDANQVLVLDIYGSAREFSGKVSSRDLVDLINKYNPGKAEHVPTIPEAIEYLQVKINSNDVVISMGAGNVWEVTHRLGV